MERFASDGWQALRFGQLVGAPARRNIPLNLTPIKEDVESKSHCSSR
jgi:hypothetical protein